ncbi:hypothetical protein V9L05_23480 (plasmid) [Bernardetia sp. Wsw4-3y2]|uniref:hypothetical protein n=1 Tax=Bernardetia sp. Wsw4-3y2 TaxID=3127471 RepID=UPI0030D20FBA
MISQKLHITITCLWLSLQLILGSVGLPIIEHYCQMSGKTNTSIIVEAKKCCCDISAANFARLTDKNTHIEDTYHLENTKDNCCDTEVSYEKANFEAISTQKIIFDFGHFIALLPSQIYLKKFTEKSFFTAFQITHFADLPPPNWKLGKLFIVFIQVFRL